MENSNRSLQKEGTRSKILKAAFKVYSEKGFGAPTSLIAKEAGVAHGSVFLHFPTLNDLLSSLIEDFGETLCSRLHERLEPGGAIEGLLEAHIGILSEYEMFYTKLISETVLLPDDARTTVAMIQTSLACHFHKALAEGIGSGALKRLPPHILFNAWIGLIHYYLQNKDFFSPEGPVLKRYEKHLIFTYCELIRRQ